MVGEAGAVTLGSAAAVGKASMGLAVGVRGSHDA